MAAAVRLTRDRHGNLTRVLRACLCPLNLSAVSLLSSRLYFKLGIFRRLKKLMCKTPLKLNEFSPKTRAILGKTQQTGKSTI